MNIMNVEKIGNFIGSYMEIYEDVLACRIHKFIQIRVLVDTTRSLKMGCWIDQDDGSKSWVYFKYERMPEFCYNCRRVGHIERTCSKAKNNIPMELEEIQRYGV